MKATTTNHHVERDKCENLETTCSDERVYVLHKHEASPLEGLTVVLRFVSFHRRFLIPFWNLVCLPVCSRLVQYLALLQIDGEEKKNTLKKIILILKKRNETSSCALLVVSCFFISSCLCCVSEMFEQILILTIVVIVRACVMLFKRHWPESLRKILDIRSTLEMV